MHGCKFFIKHERTLPLLAIVTPSPHLLVFLTIGLPHPTLPLDTLFIFGETYISFMCEGQKRSDETCGEHDIGLVHGLLCNKFVENQLFVLRSCAVSII